VRAVRWQTEATPFYLFTHDLLALIRVTHMKAPTIVALVGNNQFTGALAVAPSYFLGERHSSIRLLADAAIDSRVLPFPNDWQPSS
jgi:hypothetical protein